MLSVRDGYHNDAVRPALRAARYPIVDRGTQHHRLSAAVNNPTVSSGQGGPIGMLGVVADANCSVIVDSKVAVGRRRRHQADMRRRRRQGQRSPLWPQSAAAWPPVPRSGTLECAALGSIQTFSTICHAYVPYRLVQRAKHRPPGKTVVYGVFYNAWFRFVNTV